MQIIHEGLNEHIPGWWIGREDLKPWPAQSRDVTVRTNQRHRLLEVETQKHCRVCKSKCSPLRVERIEMPTRHRPNDWALQ